MTPEDTLIEEITEEGTMQCAMPPLVVELMDLVGFQGTMAMLKRWGGAAIYLPTVTHAFRDIRDQKIRDGFDGANYLELARRYSLTVSHVRKILREGMSCER